MIKKTLNYVDVDGNVVSDQFYFISEDPTPDQIRENVTVTNCPNCGAPIDIYTAKCPYCDTPYKFIRGKRAEVLLYEDSCRETISFIPYYEDIVGTSCINEDFGEGLSRYLKGEPITPLQIKDESYGFGE